MQALPNSGPMPADYGQPTTALPCLALDAGDGSEFDYSAFLQDQQDMDYFAEDSSGSAGGLPLHTPSPSSTFSDSALQALAPRQQQQQQLLQQLLPPAARSSGHGSGSDGGSSRSAEGQVVPKQRLERRGHTKSRRGCFNCKRRRIKCQETRPACGHCVKQGLKCEYPTLPTIVHQPQHQVPLFSLQDMRFFQHFLLNCYPHHPIGSEDLWTHEVPCLSEKYEYLMHAILGYSASDLMTSTDSSLAEAAMAHRYKAVKAIKKALSTPAAAAISCDNPLSPENRNRSSSSSPPPTTATTSATVDMFEEGNALMATCFALTYQSVLLDDGLAEFMTFIRGIMIVAIQMYCKGATLLFGHLLGDQQTARLEPYMREVALIDADWTARAVRGIAGLRELVDGPGVEGRETEKRQWELIGEMARMLGVDSWKAYLALTEHYGWWMMLPHAKFRRLVDPGNQVAVLLSAHWIALEQIMAVICETELKASARTPGKGSAASASLGNMRWLMYLNAQLDAEHRAYNEFPLWVEAQLRRDRGFFGKTFFRTA